MDGAQTMLLQDVTMHNEDELPFASDEELEDNETIVVDALKLELTFLYLDLAQPSCFLPCMVLIQYVHTSLVTLSCTCTCE